MENYKRINTVDDMENIADGAGMCHLFSRRCTNLDTIRYLQDVIETGKIITQESPDEEILQQIEDIRKELRNICISCPSVQLLENTEQESEDIIIDPLIYKGKRTKDFVRLAKSLGYVVTKGNGRHPLHVETTDGVFVTSLPCHSKPVNSYVGIKIVKTLLAFGR